MNEILTKNVNFILYCESINNKVKMSETYLFRFLVNNRFKTRKYNVKEVGKIVTCDIVITIIRISRSASFGLRRGRRPSKIGLFSLSNCLTFNSNL